MCGSRKYSYPPWRVFLPPPPSITPPEIPIIIFSSILFFKNFWFCHPPPLWNFQWPSVKEILIDISWNYTIQWKTILLQSSWTWSRKGEGVQSPGGKSQLKHSKNINTVRVRVISLSLRLRLITLTSTLIILDITKTSSNNCYNISSRQQNLALVCLTNQLHQNQ